MLPCVFPTEALRLRAGSANAALPVAAAVHGADAGSDAPSEGKALSSSNFPVDSLLRPRVCSRARSSHTCDDALAICVMRSLWAAAGRIVRPLSGTARGWRSKAFQSSSVVAGELQRWGWGVRVGRGENLPQSAEHDLPSLAEHQCVAIRPTHNRNLANPAPGTAAEAPGTDWGHEMADAEA